MGKASEAANHENGLLRAQVDRLQIELREYRKRLSQNSGLLSRTPPLGGNMFLPNAASSNNTNNFQFEFPKFGSLPGGVFGNNNVAKKASLNDNNNANGVNGVLNRNGSNGRSLSPRSQARAGGSISSEASPQANGSMSSNAGTPERSNNSVSSVFTPASFNGQSGDGSLAFDSWFTTTTSAEPESISNGQQANPRNCSIPIASHRMLLLVMVTSLVASSTMPCQLETLAPHSIGRTSQLQLG